MNSQDGDRLFFVVRSDNAATFQARFTHLGETLPQDDDDDDDSDSDSDDEGPSPVLVAVYILAVICGCCCFFIILCVVCCCYFLYKVGEEEAKRQAMMQAQRGPYLGAPNASAPPGQLSSMNPTRPVYHDTSSVGMH